MDGSRRWRSRSDEAKVPSEAAVSVFNDQESTTEGESNEATSLRAFSVDTTDEPAPRKEKPNASASDAAKADVETAPPALRVPFGAKLLFGLVVGGCAVVLVLAAPKLRAELAAKAAARNVRVAVAATAPPPASPPVPAALIAPVTPGASVTPPVSPAESQGTARSSNATDEKPSSEPSKATIRISKNGHTLKVDGKPVKGTSVDVSCGRHLVAVDAEKPHRVEAICGQTLTIDHKEAHDDKKAHGSAHSGHKSAPATSSSATPSAKAKTH
jgi:hypothetical protein